MTNTNENLTKAFVGERNGDHAERRPEKLYLDLIKKTLSFALWPEPPIPITAFNSLRSLIKRFPVSLVARILKYKKLYLVQERSIPTDQRGAGRIWPAYADTMIGLKRLDNIQFCLETVIREGVKGDLIETGVWRGGACILMRAVLAAYGIEDRKVFVADSFEGLPKPDPKRFPVDQGDRHHMASYLAVSQEDVENNFKKYNLLDDKVVFLKGWFKDTLPKAPIEKLAILRLDGDMYGSTWDALSNLYPRLSEGGFCIIDDYGLEGCKRAVDDYRAQHMINTVIKKADLTGCIYWRKEKKTLSFPK